MVRSRKYQKEKFAARRLRDLKVKHSLIRELILYEFEMGHNVAEATPPQKKNNYVQSEGVIE